jgi:hypothetical protein
MQIAFLAASAVIYMMYAYLTFGSHMDKRGLPFFACSMAVGVLYAFLWYWSARVTGSKEDFFFLVLLWDLIYILVFYFVPIALFGVRMDPWGLWGLAIVVAGFLVMKMGHFV